MSYRLSGLLNRLCGGRGDQTFCASVAERRGTDCLFCRFMEWLVEPNHCQLQLAKWREQRP